jgi:hypothetical protein
MRDLDEGALQGMLAVQLVRLPTLTRASTPSREELGTLECFWNPYLHKRRDRVLLLAIFDQEMQKLTSRQDSYFALALVRSRLQALMKMGFVGNELLEWRSEKVPSDASLWLDNDGVAYFATGFPAALRNPMLFAKRHLSLLQVVGVVVTVTLAIATFVARLSGWFA